MFIWYAAFDEQLDMTGQLKPMIFRKKSYRKIELFQLQI